MSTVELSSGGFELVSEPVAHVSRGGPKSTIIACIVCTQVAGIDLAVVATLNMPCHGAQHSW